MSSLITLLYIIILCVFTYGYVSMYNFNKCKIIKYNIKEENEITKLQEIKNDQYKDTINNPNIFDIETEYLLSNNNNLL